jgi:hypothetical protein
MMKITSSASLGTFNASNKDNPWSKKEMPLQNIETCQ